MKGATGNSIGLIGFMGTGKTTLGRALASTTGRRFIDTDTLVEERIGKSISEIFSEDGEDFFRKTESQIVSEVCGLDSWVISFGGGVVLLQSNIEAIRKSVYVVLLKASIETIALRTTLSPTRPLLENREQLLEKIKAMIENRETLYNMAKDFEIDTDAMSIEESVNEILRSICL